MRLQLTSVLKRFLKGGAIYAISDILRKLSPFILLPLYISTLSVDSFGKLEYVTVISTLFCFLIGWGSVQGLLRLYVDDGSKYVTTSILIVSLSCFLLFIVTFFLGLSSTFITLIGLESVDVLYACIIFGWLFAINNIAFTILRVEERLFEFALLNLISTIIQISAIAFFILYINNDYLSKIFGLILSNFILLVILYKKVISTKIVYISSKSYVNHALKFYTPIAFNNLLGWGKSSVDKITVKALLGDEALGFYSLAVQLTQIFKLGTESFLKSLNVLIYKNQHLVKKLENNRVWLIVILQIFALIYFLFLLAMNKYNVFGDYQISLSVIAVLLCSRVILLTNYVETLMFYAKKNSLFVMKSNLISFIVLALSIIPLVDNFGALGAALSLIISSMTHYVLLSNKLSGNLSKLLQFVVCLLLPWFFVFQFNTA
jgi:O-antigen/teichoic acid export membrane protein